MARAAWESAAGGTLSGAQSSSSMYGGRVMSMNFHPHALTLLLALAIEMFLFGLLRWVFRSAHGG